MIAEQDIKNSIKKSVASDANGLGHIAEQKLLLELSKHFKNYSDFLNKNNKSNKKLVTSLFSKTGILDIGSSRPELKNILYIAHIAVCCDLFNGMKISPDSLNISNMDQYIQKLFNDITESSLKSFETKIHTSDTVRTCQILRLLGLYNRKSHTTRQISIAAGSGTRDINGLHSTPEIQEISNPFTSGSQSHKNILLVNNYTQPELAILIDNDSQYASYYEKLNSESASFLLALNEDINDSLTKLPTLMAEKNWKAINLIAGFRIDHRMFPDIKYFFKLIKPTLDDIADLIITIGAGHTLEEFIGRKKTIINLFDYLKGCGFDPKIITLHSGKTAEEQRNQPYFGNTQSTTYEILYCKIKSKKLKM